MEFLLDKKQARQVEEAFGEDLVYIWLKGPCRRLRSWKQIIDPSSLFYVCYQGLDLLKKYGDWQDPRALQEMQYVSEYIYDDLEPKYTEEEADEFHRDIFLIIVTLCELLRLPKDETLQIIAEGVYGWITRYEDGANDNYRTQLMQLANEIEQEYRYHSPMLIMANRMEREGAIHHSGEVNIISYVRNYLNSKRRISEEIKELLNNEGDRNIKKVVVRRNVMYEERASEGASRENVERLEKRVKELEEILEEKEREMIEIREGETCAENGTPIRIAKGKKTKTIVLLAAMFYAKFFESTDENLTNRDHFLDAILRYGFGEKDQKSLRQALDNYEERDSKMRGLKQDLRQAVDEALKDMKSFQNEEKFPAK